MLCRADESALLPSNDSVSADGYYTERSVSRAGKSSHLHGAGEATNPEPCFAGARGLAVSGRRAHA